MTLTDEQKKMLTEEVLGECWHEGSMPINCGYRCIKCGDTYTVNRPFTTDADMMALYRAIRKNDSWFSFCDFARQKCININIDDYEEIVAWFLCLDGKDQEARCCLVAEWWVEK
jgi:hypothetical protein